MNNIDKQYQLLLTDILENGVSKTDRTGTGTISVFGRQIRHKMSEGFPLLTTKKMPWKSMVVELLWFLRGDTNIQYLLENGCHIWTGDAYKNYMKHMNKQYVDGGDYADVKQFEELIVSDDDFAKEFGELGPIYGKQWRRWVGLNKTKDKITQFDQIVKLVYDIKETPDSRRLMVNAWNVSDIDQMVLPPCHYGFQVYTRELSIEERLDLASKTYKELFEPFDFYVGDHDEIDKLYPVPKRAISLMWNQRSVDTFLGLPFNIASYALLLEIIAKEVDMVPDELVGNLGDVHLYSNHVEQAEEQINRVPLDLPKLNIVGVEPSIITKPRYWKWSDFVIENYQSHPSIKAPLSN